MNLIDWQTGKTLSESTKYMLENSVNCDVNFKVGEDQEMVKAHKFILSIRSAVFDRMFNGSFCESEMDPVIPDVSPAAFKALLRFCYYDCFDIQDEVALSVLHASTKYMLPLLEEAARKKLIDILSSSKYIWDVYKYAVNVGDTELNDACKKYFQGNVTLVRESLQAEAFLNIPHNVLLDFLHINDEVDKSLLIRENQMGKLNQEPVSMNYQNCIGVSISEIEVFKACNAWVEAECLRQEIDPTGINKRTVLGECLFLIRFPTMLQEDLANVVYPTGILTQEEVIKLCQYIQRKTGSHCKTKFQSRERQFVVTEPVTALTSSKSSVSIDSGERVILSRIWTIFPGSYRVTVMNNSSERSWSTKCDTQYENHTARLTSDDYNLYFIDIEPQVLEAGTIYSITADIIQASEHPDAKPDMKLVTIGKLALCFKELKLSHESWNDLIYALTLCLV